MRPAFAWRNRVSVFLELFPPERCEACEKDVEPYMGYACDRCGRLERYPISLSRITPTALDRGKASAAPIPYPDEAFSTLHTLELINKGSRFTLETMVHRDYKEDLNVNLLVKK